MGCPVPWQDGFSASTDSPTGDPVSADGGRYLSPLAQECCGGVKVVLTAMRSLILLLTLPLYILDQITKEWTVRTFVPPTDFTHDFRTVIPGFFDLVRVHNTGVAFGMGNGSTGANYVFGAVSLAAVGLIVWLHRAGAFPHKTSRVAVALLLSGIFGNLTDRLFRGYVVDFLSFDLKFMQWPAFNVADAAICIAAGLLFFSAFQKPVPTPAPAQPPQEA
ncbi:MAG: signal peptidase (spase) ii [Verrucomicrobiales bacterium]|nr:signal peptidase (spase) ii [Verrucomicrobiales bacterium]